VAVRIENGTSGRIVIPNESMIGFALGGDRLEVVVYSNGRMIQLCAHLDPPLAPTPPTVLGLGAAETRKVSIDLIKRVYCLRAARYQVQAKLSTSSIPVTSQLASVDLRQ